MSKQFATFGSLKVGAEFRARGVTWVKAPGRLTLSPGRLYNAYEQPTVLTGPHDPLQSALFDDAALVLFDDTRPLARWATDT